MEAVNFARSAPYDLVLMDMQLPLVGGLGATRAIRKLPGSHQRPMLALTAKACAENRQASDAAGTNVFFTKPMDVNTLYVCLLRWPGAPASGS